MKVVTVVVCRERFPVTLKPYMKGFQYTYRVGTRPAVTAFADGPEDRAVQQVQNEIRRLLLAGEA